MSHPALVQFPSHRPRQPLKVMSLSRSFSEVKDKAFGDLVEIWSTLTPELIYSVWVSFIAGNTSGAVVNTSFRQFSSSLLQEMPLWISKLPPLSFPLCFPLPSHYRYLFDLNFSLSRPFLLPLSWSSYPLTPSPHFLSAAVVFLVSIKCCAPPKAHLSHILMWNSRKLCRCSGWRWVHHAQCTVVMNEGEFLLAYICTDVVVDSLSINTLKCQNMHLILASICFSAVLFQYSLPFHVF